MSTPPTKGFDPSAIRLDSSGKITFADANVRTIGRFQPDDFNCGDPSIGSGNSGCTNGGDCDCSSNLGQCTNGGACVGAHNAGRHVGGEIVVDDDLVIRRQFFDHAGHLPVGPRIGIQAMNEDHRLARAVDAVGNLDAVRKKFIG